MKIKSNRPALLEQKWKSYTAAGAAVAAAGFVGNAQAAIMFIDYNDTVVVDPIVGDGVNPGPTGWGTFNINFDGDAQVDVLLAYRQFTTGGTANLFPAAGATTSVVGFVTAGFNYPSRLAANASVGASAVFIPVNGGPQAGRGDLAWGNGSPNSQWVAPAGGPPSTGYLGLKFKIAGQDHFGWVRISIAPVAAPTPRFLTVHDAAYETVPGVGIPAGATGIPEPASLGLLALGSLGLTTMRRRKSAAA